MQALLDLIKKLLPNSVLKKIRPLGHGFLAYLAALRYGFPSARLIVIGVTGTSGKSTTIQMLAKILNSVGRKTGYATTVGFFDGEQQRINSQGMSMPGRFGLQRDLRAMADRGCQIAIVECTSEGLAQNRHLGVNFDLALLTNLSEAHIEAHGSFEQYKRAKARLFAATSRGKKKKFFSKKILGLNLDSADPYFFSFAADEKFGITRFDPEAALLEKKVNKVYWIRAGSPQAFKLNEQEFVLTMPGEFNYENAALAAACAASLDVALGESAAALRDFSGVLGRMQRIPNDKGFGIYLDYAPEPAGMRAALDSLKPLVKGRIIHVFGSTGGHRDVRKRFEFGAISAQRADVIVITNDDVYDSDPQAIAADVQKGIEQVAVGNRRAMEVRTILDRREAIKTALKLARPEDAVIITGKGSEQFLILPGNKRIAWDEQKVIEEALA